MAATKTRSPSRKEAYRLGLHRKFDEMDSAFQCLFLQYKGRMHRRNLEFSLTIDEFLYLTQQNCFYCGALPASIYKGYHGRYLPFIYNTIDRKDYKLGYILDNCVSACLACNIMKHKLNVEEFFLKVKQIYFYLLEKET